MYYLQNRNQANSVIKLQCPYVVCIVVVGETRDFWSKSVLLNLLIYGPLFCRSLKEMGFEISVLVLSSVLVNQPTLQGDGLCMWLLSLVTGDR